jgi:hypothetical protein
VLGCMTTTVQLAALVRRTCWAQAFCAAHCRPDRIVSRTSPPGTIGRTQAEATGIGSPFVPVSTSSWPSLPARSELKDSSTPACPRRSPALVVVVKPTRLDARSPPG